MIDRRSGFFRPRLPVVCMASVLCGCDIGDSPSRVGTVRLDALVAEFSVPVEADAAGAGIVESDWPPEIEAALAAVAERRDAVLFPAGTALVGAADHIHEVAFELARSTVRIGNFGALYCASQELGVQTR